MTVMRGVAITVLLSFLLPIPLHAAPLEETTLEIGAKAAYGHVTFFRGGGIQGVSTLKYRSGFAIGLFCHHAILATERLNLGVQPELLFVRRGAELEYQGAIVDTVVLDYLDVPVLARAFYPISDSINPYIIAGPRFGVLLGGTSKDVNGTVRDRSDSTNSFDIGITAGVGALIPVGTRFVLTLEGRYDQSLVNSVKASGEEVTNDQRHRAFFLMLGVSMGIGSPSRPSGP